jgi:probable F420-dependent oxidoreductase
MRFGVQHAVGDPAWVREILSPDAVSGFARAAEAGGFELLAFTDHPAPSGRWADAGGEGVADPFSSLAFCAAVTSSIRLLTWVLIPAYRNPFLAAHQLATLDVLSGGRLVVGLGTGYLRSEFHALGADPATRLADFDRNVDIMKQAWAGGDVTVDADGFSARGIRINPPPVQTPHPPLWIHGNSPWGLARAATVGQGWIAMFTTGLQVSTVRTTPLPDLDTLRHRIEQLHGRIAEAGRRPEDVAVVATGIWPQLDVRRDWSADRFLTDTRALADAGVDMVVVNSCGDDPGAAEESVRRFGEDVVGPSGR